MNVSFAVQAHQSRTVAAARLAQQIGGEVVYDPGDGTPLRSPWRSFRELLATTPADATHRVQIQDDATACRGFRETVLRAVAAQPDRVLVFYVGQQKAEHMNAVRDACNRDRTWTELQIGSWCPVVSTCWPREHAEGLLAWAQEEHDRWPRTFVADDEIVGRYLTAVKHRPLATVPSLVEHEDTTPSVMGRGHDRASTGRARLAACYVGDCLECVDGLDFTLPPHNP